MRFTIPNILTFFRLLAAPCIAIFLILDINAVIVLLIFLLAAISDYFDGYLARAWDQSSSLGKVLDPIADKAMVIISLCFLHYSFDSEVEKIFFGIPVIAIVFREVFVSGLREYVGKNSDVLIVTSLSKWKTSLQLISIGTLLASKINLFYSLHLNTIGIVILWFAAVVTIITGVDYFKKALVGIKG